jgi:drug/metabolite transporter (DMT)-like permease
MNRSDHTRAILQALLVTFLWSTSWVLIKKSIHELPPLIFAGLRYALAALILLPALWKHRDIVRKLTRRQWLSLVLLGLVFYTLTQGGQFMTLKYLDAIPFSLILNFSAPVVALLGIFLLKETPSIIQWGGILLFLVGVAVYFFPLSFSSSSGLGLILAGLTVAANAGAALLGRAINRLKNIPAGVVTAISMGIGAFVLLGIGIMVEPFPVISPLNWLVIFWLAAINTALAFTLWNKSQQVLSAVESSVINNTMLIQITLLAWLFLGESINLKAVIGLLLAAVGVFFTNFKSQQQTKIPNKVVS